MEKELEIGGYLPLNHIQDVADEECGEAPNEKVPFDANLNLSPVRPTLNFDMSPSNDDISSRSKSEFVDLPTTKNYVMPENVDSNKTILSYTGCPPTSSSMEFHAIANKMKESMIKPNLELFNLEFDSNKTKLSDTG